METQQSIWENQFSFLSAVNYEQFIGLSYPTKKQIEAFQTIIYDYYKRFGRVFSWRQMIDPYKIIVSEVMLQQTQTSRVATRYEQFIGAFPDFSALSKARLHDVIFHWQGLGYNRRGKYLWEVAKKVETDFGGNLPNDTKILEIFPGIGKATAASICAFAFNAPTIFIETNIRTVFTKFFFRSDVLSVHDRDIEPLVAAMLDKKNARAWYYALTDFGVGLKKHFPSLNAKSAHYNKQSKFEGSDRQIRGKILKLLSVKKSAESQELAVFCTDQNRLEKILKQLQKEKLILQTENAFEIG